MTEFPFQFECGNPEKRKHEFSNQTGIGPAVAAKVKLLCTGDEKLMGDFKKRVPRGPVHRV